MSSAGLQPGCRTGLQARTGYFTSQRIVETGLTKLAMGDRKIPLAEAGQAPAQGAVNPRFGETRIRTRRLPHWEKDEGLYFVTFRLADSLPRQVIERMMERHRILRAAKENGAHLLPHQKTLIAEFSSAKIEEYFDRGIGAWHLRDPRIANLVANTLRLRHGRRYRLVAWCIMPNHVHVVLRLFPGQELAAVMCCWKSFTARMANRILQRSGAFWQREYYDRLIRNGDEFERAVRYVVTNPERAGLQGWEWVWSTGVDARTTTGLHPNEYKSFVGDPGLEPGATASGATS